MSSSDICTKLWVCLRTSPSVRVDLDARFATEEAARQWFSEAFERRLADYPMDPASGAVTWNKAALAGIRAQLRGVPVLGAPPASGGAPTGGADAGPETNYAGAAARPCLSWIPSRPPGPDAHSREIQAEVRALRTDAAHMRAQIARLELAVARLRGAPTCN